MERTERSRLIVKFENLREQTYSKPGLCLCGRGGGGDNLCLSTSTACNLDLKLRLISRLCSPGLTKRL